MFTGPEIATLIACGNNPFSPSHSNDLVPLSSYDLDMFHMIGIFILSIPETFDLHAEGSA